MISKRISGRKDGKSSASTALRYGEGLIPDRETGEFLEKSHRTRFGNFGIIDDGVYAGRNRAEMARLIELAAIEMQTTCDLNTRVGADKKLAHFVVSFNQYKPSEAVLRDVEDSMLAAMKLDKNHFATFVHNDNGYWHLHIFASRIEQGKPPRGNPLWHDQINRDRVCREVEMRHGLQRDHGFHEIDKTGQIVEIPRAERQAKRELKLGGISDRAKSIEIYSGEKSFQTWCSEIRIGDRLKHAKSWPDIHAAAAAYHCGIKQKGSGFVVCPFGEKGGIQLSKVGLKNLPAKFGAFQPAAQGQQIKPEIAFKPAPGEAKATPDYGKWREARNAFKTVKTAAINEQRGEHQKIRKDLRARHQAELVKLRAATRGQDRVVAVSVMKMKQTIALAALTDQFATERRAQRIGLAKQGQGNTFRDYLVNEAASGENTALGLARRYGREESTEVFRHREVEHLKIVAALSGQEYRSGPRLNFTHRVERNGTVVFDLGQGRTLTDSAIARQVQLNDAAANSPEAIATALGFAATKFGNTLSLTGSPAFQRLAVETAVRRGLNIQFKDTALQAYKQELAASIKEKMAVGKPYLDLSHLTRNQIDIGVEHVLTSSFDKGIPPDHIIRAEANRRSLAAQGSSGMHELPIGGLDVERKIAGMLLPHALPNRMGNKQAGENQDLRRTGPGARRRRSAGEYPSTTSQRSQLPLIVASSLLNQQVQGNAVPAAEKVGSEARDIMSEQRSPLTAQDQALAARIEQAIEKNNVLALEKCWNEIGSPKREAAHAIGAAQSATEHESHTARYDSLLNLSKRLERILNEHKENEIFKQGGADYEHSN
jgi:hypothetical protein